MAYFANGTEGSIFFDQYCVRCVHCGGCPIWDLHLTWNYEQFMGRDDEEMTPEKQAKTTALNLLMPRTGTTNTCAMFYPAAVPSLPDENKQIITIATKGAGTRDIEACVYGNFAVHRAIVNRTVSKTFSVTHLPTQMALPLDFSLDDALNLVKRLNALEIDTSFTDIKSQEYGAFTKVALPIMREYQ